MKPNADNRQLDIATGKTRMAKTWHNKQISWPELVERLSNTKVTPETYEEYMAAKKSRQDEIKDVGGYVGGYLNSGSRKRGSAVRRQIVTLDIDFATTDFWEDFTLFYGEAAVLHSTHKHSPEKPRYRLIIPLDRPVDSIEYQAIARRIAGNLGIELFDKTTFEPERLMHWPSTSAGAEYVFKEQKGKWLSAHDVLSVYNNYKNALEWPRSSQDKAIQRDMKKLGDPEEKPGRIGEFCRAYNIHEAIEAFLYEVYEPTASADRYSLIGGESSAGLVVYEDKFAHSHHESDPACGKSCNAFDLVRIHRFGLQDEGASPDTPINELPSYLAMCAFVAQDERVKEQIALDREGELHNDFRNVNTSDVAEQQSGISSNLKIILDSREKLRELKANEIKFAAPVLRQGENAVIFPHTINVIQGQAGVHKSRLAENICSAFLKQPNCNNELLGFNKSSINASYTVVYVDTERNLTEQLPYALQSIQLKAGYSKTDHPGNFEYISLLQIPRKERFAALNEYLNHIKKSTNNPLFIVLDVSTDCIEDFNKTDKSMELIDLMNVAINEHNVIFLCIIHENPKSDKARGHFGTELMNKASTVMQVNFEKDGNQNDTDLIRVKYLKCRSSARHTPFYIKYSDEAKGLVLADASEVSGVADSRKQKAGNDDVIEYIEMYLGDGTVLTRRELLDNLCNDFKAGQRTIEKRINEIINSDNEFSNEKGEKCVLSKETKEKTVYYKLKPIESLI